MRFHDRHEAGRRLGGVLQSVREKRPIVLALPRGGVPVAAEVARALGAPLDVLVVRKLGAPGTPETCLGALAEGGAIFLDGETLRNLSIDPRDLEELAETESAKVTRQARKYRQGRCLPSLAGRAVILVDDGIATGATARAAVRAVRRYDARQVVLAAPIIARDAANELRDEVDQLVSLDAAADVSSVSGSYEDFANVSDEEVAAALERARAERPSVQADAGDLDEVGIPLGERLLRASLGVPRGAQGLVIFADGTAAARRDPGHQRVAHALREVGFATLVPDLLTDDEAAEDERTHRYRSDVRLFAQRLLVATSWAALQPATAGLRAGYFGAHIGAAAALVAAARAPGAVDAIVARGGRPDLAGPAHLAAVRAPTLLLFGTGDPALAGTNRKPISAPPRAELVVVQGAADSFEEPAALETVARLSVGWFHRHLGSRRHAATA